MSEMSHFKLGNITLSVFFAYDTVTDGDAKCQWVTTCGLRVNREVETYWGHTIQNPQDELQVEHGAQVAARRAFVSLINQRYHGLHGQPITEPMLRSDKYLKRKFSRFSNALHCAGAW